MTETVLDADLFTEQWRAWHAEKEDERRKPHGFLAYSGFHFLDGVPRRFPGLPGVWSTGEAGPLVELADNEGLIVDDRPVTGSHAWGVIAERSRHKAYFGDAAAEVSRRGGYDLVRPLHPDHALRVNYRGTPAFPPDPRWVIVADFEPFAQSEDLQVDSAIAPIRHTHSSPGRVRFTFEGQRYALTLIDRGPGKATILFRDATSGVTTYAASRTLAVELPDPESSRAGGAEVVLDFNRASNLQCAYTDYAPCPLAPPENRLPFAVEAGEQTPLDRTS